LKDMPGHWDVSELFDDHFIVAGHEVTCDFEIVRCTEEQ
jgi:hypothetical protein